MRIGVLNQQSSLPIDKPSVRSVVRAFLKLEEVSCNEVSIHFIDTKETCRIHNDYFGDPTTTDCMSFPLMTFPLEDQADAYRLLGDVFVCPETALNYPAEHGGNPYEETTLYIIHGMLHLLGYDDRKKAYLKKIREAEAKHMKNLKQHNLLIQRPKVYTPLS